MKNIAITAVVLVFAFACHSASAQVYRQVCENGTCQLVEVAPVRNTVSAVVNVVSDTPPVPVMYSVMENTAVKTMGVTRNITRVVMRPVSRACCSVRKLVNRVRIFKR